MQASSPAVFRGGQRPAPQELPSLPLEYVVPVGIGRETGVRPYLTKDDVHFTLVAALHADRVLDPLEPPHPGALYGGLNEVLREYRRGCRRTVHFEFCALEGTLHRSTLLLVEHLLLAGAARRDRHRGVEHQKRPYFFRHESLPFSSIVPVAATTIQRLTFIISS